MKYLIISTEYEENLPSIFLFDDGDGRYYGCKIYPKGRNYPKNIKYWADASCSDEDRFFKIKEVNLTDEQMAIIKKLQNVIDANQSMIVSSIFPYIKRDFNIKRGKKYQVWKEATDKQNEAIKNEYEYNRPYIFAGNAAYRELRNLLLSL